MTFLVRPLLYVKGGLGLPTKVWLPLPRLPVFPFYTKRKTPFFPVWYISKAVRSCSEAGWDSKRGASERGLGGGGAGLAKLGPAAYAAGSWRPPATQRSPAPVDSNKKK